MARSTNPSLGQANFGTVARTVTAATDNPTRADTSARGGKLVVNRASGVTVTFDPATFLAGDTVEVLNIGAGVVTLAPGAGVTLSKRALDTLTLAQGGRARVEFISATVAWVSGSLVLA